jgi:FtsP/CotA-like multicopper oxidase with cupredoxin domain
MARIRVKESDPVRTPDVFPPLAAEFIPASTFTNVKVGKTWDLNAVRGGKYGIGWSMNYQLWPTADTAAFVSGKPVRIRFINSSSRLHPMHLHGVFFRVLEVNGQPHVEPFTRDTVLVGPRESVVIGFIPEHEGIWLTHCHIRSHAESGMMTTIRVD